MTANYFFSGSDNLRRQIILKRAQPVFLGDGQTLSVSKRFVKLVVIGKFKFGKDLIDGIHPIRYGL